MNHLLEIASKHKKVTVGVIVAILAVGGVAFASMTSHPAPQTNHDVEAHASNNHKEALAKVDQLRKDMEAEKDDQKKLDDLKQIEVKYQKYKKEPTSYRKLTNAYQDAIHSGKAYFINKTNKNIQDLTVEDIDQENDTDSLNGKIKSLQVQLKFVNDNKKSVFTKDNVKNYTKQINGLVKKYQDRVKQLDEQKKNDDAKKESERKATEQSSQVAQSSQQNGASAQNQNQNGNNANGQSSSMNGNRGQNNNNYSSNGNLGNSYSQPSQGNSYSKPSQPSRPSRPTNNGGGNSGNGNNVWRHRTQHWDDGATSSWDEEYNPNTDNTTIHLPGAEEGGYGFN
ncbi:MAG TPA: hypothetical protein K8V00_01435 [Ligilactobacillus acidipiscis]|uniref:Uncharacterized protein n=1 Tax=Ligilactobacillus acidipiscis TaxID=89059 RepID=A0A921F7W6_9LACO|nr:hypothetical protein [Ligilactobacillus acidipiscis]